MLVRIKLSFPFIKFIFSILKPSYTCNNSIYSNNYEQHWKFTVKADFKN